MVATKNPFYTEDELREIFRRAAWSKRIGAIVLDRKTCDWVIDNTADTAMCRTHGEIADGVKSKHFPGAHLASNDEAM